MKNRFLDILDNKATWATLGIFAGTLLGDKAAAIVQGIGFAVMAAI